MKTAITGGIGSGKSYVCSLLRSRGIQVYDCDSAAKRLMHQSQDLRRRLQALVGPALYSDGRLDKAVMARYMMQSPANILAVNGIVHPAVADDFIGSGMQWMECAILFESGFDRLVDNIVCVTAPIDVRIARVMSRDGITRGKAIEWIERQLPQDDVAARSSHVINNDGVTPLAPQVDALIASLSTQ